MKENNKLVDVTEDELKFLTVYVTWPDGGVDYDVIETLLPGSDDILHSLIEKKILSYEDESFHIDKRIADSFRKQLDFEKADYSDYFWNIKKNVVFNSVNQNYTQIVYYSYN